MKLRTMAACFVIALTAACSGGDPDETGDEGAGAACAGAECPAAQPATEAAAHPAKVTVPDIKLGASTDATAHPAKVTVPDIKLTASTEVASPAKVTVPDIKLGVSAPAYEPWAAPANGWFVDGQHLEENEMSGGIGFLNPAMKDEIGEIGLVNTGFNTFSKDDSEANSEKIAR